MFSRIGHLLLIIALLGAAGGHWAAWQSLAWARMLADNARVAPLSQALVKTFDGKHPCALCKRIAKARGSEKKPDTQLEIKKLEFLRESALFVIASPEHFILCDEHAVFHASLTETPPVPPPRNPAI